MLATCNLCNLYGNKGAKKARLIFLPYYPSGKVTSHMPIIRIKHHCTSTFITFYKTSYMDKIFSMTIFHYNLRNRHQLSWLL